MQNEGWNLSLSGKKPTTCETVKEVSRMAERALKDQDRFNDSTSTSFYACLVFQSDDQRDAFVEAMKWREAQDDEDPCFLDGCEIAQRMGVVLPECPPIRKTQKHERWAKLAQET